MCTKSSQTLLVMSRNFFIFVFKTIFRCVFSSTIEISCISMWQFNWYSNKQLFLMEHRLKWILFDFGTNVKLAPKREVDKVVHINSTIFLLEACTRRSWKYVMVKETFIEGNHWWFTVGIGTVSTNENKAILTKISDNSEDKHSCNKYPKSGKYCHH